MEYGTVTYQVNVKHPTLLWLVNIIPQLLGLKPICPSWMVSFDYINGPKD